MSEENREIGKSGKRKTSGERKSSGSDIDSAPTEAHGLDTARTLPPDPMTASLTRQSSGSGPQQATRSARNELPVWAIELGHTVEGLKEEQEVFHGRFTLVERIGRGGMGMVWRARDKELNREVALKFLPEALMSDEKAVLGLKKETKNALELSTHHVVRIHDFITDGRMAGISMEYVDGLSLAKRAGRQPEGIFEVSELRVWVGHLCEALSYAHETAKVIHRDLKPANLMVNSKGELKVADFGISARLGRTRTTLASTKATGGGATSGTPQYMSPQQMMGDDPAPSDDIYALGATLYDLLTGEPPFYEGEIGMQVLNKVPPPLSERRAKFGVGKEPIPAAWEETIAACLEKDPAKRPRSAREVAQRLDGKSENREIRLRPGASPDNAGKLENRNEGPTLAGGAEPGSGKRGQTPTEAGLAAPGSSRFKKYIPAIVGALALAFAGWWFVGSYLPAKRIADAERAGKSENREIRLRPSASPDNVGKSENVKPLSSPRSGVGDNADSPASPPGAASPGLSPPRSGMGNHAEAAPQTLPKEFIVLVDPADAGAQVWLGTASATPDAKGRAVVKDLTDGEHELTVSASGYQPYSTRVSVEKGCGSALAKLVPVRGALSVKARPRTQVLAIDARGREIRLGAVPASGTLESTNLLMIGAYGLKLEHPDCEPASVASVELRIGRAATVSVPQTPLPGEVRVISVPDQVDLVLDGRRVGKTPLSLRALESEKEHRLDLSLRGYRSGSTRFTLKPKELRTLNLGTLTAESGGVELRGSLPAGASVKVDGREHAFERVSGGLRLEGLEVGEHTVDVQYPEYELWTGKVAVSDEQISPLSPVLKPKPGRLNLQVSGPERIEVRVGGKAATLDGNDLLLAAQEEHTVELSAPGYKTLTRRVRLAAGGRETLSATMEKQRGTEPKAGQKEVIADLGLELMPLAAGRFTMGGDKYGDEKPLTEVTLTKGYWLGRTEVTQGQWEALMGNNPSNFKGSDRPVEQVSWEDAMGFCRKLTERERAAGRLPEGYAYTLPTEAQWEYACRAGTTGDYAGNLASMGWYKQNRNSGNQTHAVGQKQANAWGLYDMHGNVWEWCADWYADKLPGGSVRDPTGAASGSLRVFRGGGWGDGASLCRSASRSWGSPGSSISGLGFRLALSSISSPPQVISQSQSTVQAPNKTLSYAQSNRPYENSLGMKFLPLPGTQVLCGIWETRVQDFEAFVNATRYDATGGMYSFDETGNWALRGATWKSPGFTQSGRQPVVGVSQEDARAFCAWLTKKEQAEGRLGAEQSYRLPTDAEWDAAVGSNKYPWGDQFPPPNGAGNYADATLKRLYPRWRMPVIEGYEDGYGATAPVGSFTANRLGIYDLGGNAWEWVEDRNRGARGASFYNDGSDRLASSYRSDNRDRGGSVGFRVVVGVRSAAR